MAPLVGSGLWFGSSGNNGRGIFAIGNTTTTTNIYTYANNAVTTGTNLTAGVYEGAATGNSTLGIFAMGGGTNTSVYTYKNNGVTTGTSLTADLRIGTAASTSPGGF